MLDEDKREELRISLSVDFHYERWDYDTQDEFFADIRKEDVRNYAYQCSHFSSGLSIDVDFCAIHFIGTDVSVSANSRSDVEKIFDVFERNVEASRLPKPSPPPESPPPQPKVFIGYGRSPQWRDLKDHLQDQHGLQVEAYEIGHRAGHTVRDILDELLTRSTIAFLVMTGEDETADGKMRARQNVIHEIGLFQGRLGFSKGVVLLEEGTEEFSNIQGIQQIRFSKGNIRETFGDVLATLKREFPDSTI